MNKKLFLTALVLFFKLGTGYCSDTPQTQPLLTLFNAIIIGDVETVTGILDTDPLITIATVSGDMHSSENRRVQANYIVNATTGYTNGWDTRNSLLHLAVTANQPHVALALLKRRANPNALNMYNETPLHYAQTRLMISLLLYYGAVLQPRTPSWSPLERATYFGYTDVALFLREYELAAGTRLSLPSRLSANSAHLITFTGSRSDA